jgi:hypothetical protein
VLRQAPIQFVLERAREEEVDEEEHDNDDRRDVNTPSLNSTKTSPPSFWHSQVPPSRDTTASEQRTFRLYAEPWTGDHRAYNERQKLFNPLPRLPASHPIRADLAKRVPLIGLADCILEPKGGEMEIAQLRKWAKECEERPRLRDWAREREERYAAGADGVAGKKREWASRDKEEEEQEEETRLFDPMEPVEPRPHGWA